MTSVRPHQVPRSEIETMVDMLATNVRLGNPLPADTDFSEEENKETQAQLSAIDILPPWGIEPIYLAFSAKYLAKLVTALRALNRETQRQAVSTYIQILSLLPDPKVNAYLRKFLGSPKAAGLPNLVTYHFLEGISWLRPSGPGHICALLIHLLFWCDASMGDDGKASIDKELRERLAVRLQVILGQPGIDRLPYTQRIELERLSGALNPIREMPEDYYIKSMQDYLKGQVEGQEDCLVCMDDAAELLCSQCKSVRFCGRECQLKAWKHGHKQRCWAMVE